MYNKYLKMYGTKKYIEKIVPKDLLEYVKCIDKKKELYCFVTRCNDCIICSEGNIKMDCDTDIYCEICLKFSENEIYCIYFADVYSINGYRVIDGRYLNSEGDI